MDSIPLSNLFNYLPESIRRHQSDDVQLMSWAMQAMRTLNFKDLTNERNLFFGEVNDHILPLPPDIQGIIMVKHLEEQRDDVVHQLVRDSVEPINNSFANPCPLMHRLFLASPAYREHFRPLKPIKNASRAWICNYEMDNCGGSYSITSDGCTMRTSMPCGYVAIEYWSTMKDERSGEMMIPSSPEELWMFLAAYVQEMHWRNRMSMKEQGAANLYQQFKIERIGYAKTARAKLTMANMDIANQRDLVYGMHRMVRVPQSWIEDFANRYVLN